MLIPWVFVSPKRCGDPAGAVLSATEGTVPEVHKKALFGGIATLDEIGDLGLPVNVTEVGAWADNVDPSKRPNATNERIGDRRIGDGRIGDRKPRASRH
jgi:hypothetical protein